MSTQQLEPGLIDGTAAAVGLSSRVMARRAARLAAGLDELRVGPGAVLVAFQVDETSEDARVACGAALLLQARLRFLAAASDIDAAFNTAHTLDAPNVRVILTTEPGVQILRGVHARGRLIANAALPGVLWWRSLEARHHLPVDFDGSPVALALVEADAGMRRAESRRP
jgi:hypothetical protein